MQDSTVYSPKGEKELLEKIRNSIELTQERLNVQSATRATHELQTIADLLKEILDEGKATRRSLRMALLLLTLIVVALVFLARI